jgi:hypothetical protein
MKVCLEVLMELVFCSKSPNFGVEAHMEPPTGVALIYLFHYNDPRNKFLVNSFFCRNKTRLTVFTKFYLRILCFDNF